MTLTELIQKSYLLATGKATAPSSGTAKYERLLGIANVMIQHWEQEIDWMSLYTTSTLVPTVSATDTFTMVGASPTIRRISQQEGDYIKINHTGSQESLYTLVRPDQLQRFQYSDAVARIGNSLKFSSAFTATSPQLGGTIEVPCYKYASTLSAGSDTVPVDDPNWLVYMTAAEYVRNDVTKENQYGNLIALAQDSMNKMLEANGGQDTSLFTAWNPTSWSEF